ncbi:Starch-binding associating with outer membrane [Arachidicoccus rhizosphaerae]|uniref:Starch-binding associating with outer membrane n=1 Tax=Arachidicoccus rhizosphaerae TaxID=551991 RepID=A0A1H4AZM1_9BACT|nr:SusD/RagB family nutrient-binding outer membrane lipoprotein [Arachidicoccus rhizosphaerae]SEA41319.1 Starch-binding associating with outer membrane [Arachidicoccus rhizosphaerae]
MKYSIYQRLLRPGALLISGLLVLAASSCKKELVRINKNPNAVENPQPDYLLGAAEKTGADVYWGQSSNFASSQLITQQWAMIQYTDPDRYIFNGSSFSTLWTTTYSSTLTDIKVMMQLGVKQQNNNYVGVGHVLRAWNFQLLTDAFGAVPYSEAGQIETSSLASYDSQQEVYSGILNELDTALTQLDPNGTAIEGDLIYGNNISDWRKFANSLKLRIALRIADADPTLAKATVQQVLSSGELIASNSQNAQFVYKASPNWNPVAANFSTRNDYRISKTVVDQLYSLNDPRLPVFASLPDNNAITKYVGVPNGLTTSDANSLGLANTSKPGSYFLQDTAPAILQTYSEVLFLRAEAAARNLSSEDAAALYQSAITASLNQYGITDASQISSYLNQASVKYDASNFKKSIGNQKWISLFGEGLEAFAEWRRLDYPQLTAAVSGKYGDDIPVRFIYPSTEQTLNGKAYKAAVAEQGTDDLFTKLWFDKN